LHLSACSTVNGPKQAHDPWEGMNRSFYKFNDVLDKNILRPVAKGYDKVIPQPIDQGIDNVLSNLGEPVVVFNDVLQGKWKQVVSDTTRFILNSSFGLLGIFDVAEKTGLKKHQEDFGQTLGYWGINNGPYLVIPFLGPSTVRDASGRLVDAIPNTAFLNEIGIDTVEERVGLIALSIINARQALLGIDELVETSGADPYIFVRESYLQRRSAQVNDTLDAAPTDGELSSEDEDALFGDE